MQGTLGQYKIVPNELYKFHSAELRILFKILEDGLSVNGRGRITYDQNKPIYKTFLQKKLEGEIAPQVVDQSMGEFFDYEMLAHPHYPQPPMEIFEDAQGERMWARPIRIDPEAASRLIGIFLSAHYVFKNNRRVKLY